MYYIVIRESRPNDIQAISEVVRNAYTSNVSNAWWSALFNEATFQSIILLAAFMFIFMGVPLFYCLISVPVVLILMYILLYGSILMKATELVHGKSTLSSWVAEAYEPYFFVEKPETCTYQIIPDDKIREEDIDLSRYRKQIIGTCAVTRHNVSDDWAWLFRMAVDQKYRKKGVGLMLAQTAQNWCRNNRYNYVELVITECQEDARQMFGNAGFQVKQLYHKRLLTNVFTMQMFHLRCEVRPTFNE